MNAPKKLCFVNCGLPADQCACYRQFLDETFLPTILATDHDRMMAEKGAEIARLKAISDIANWMDDPEGREHIGAVRGARSIARAAAIRALKGGEE